MGITQKFTEIKAEIKRLSKSVNDKITDLKSNIPTKLSSFINDMGYITENPDLSIYATKEELNAKQDTITDLSTIRTNANKGATALQSETDPVYTTDKPNIALKSDIPDISKKADKSEIPDISGLATKEDIPDISNLALKAELPTKVSELENDTGYLTEHQDISKLATKTELQTGLKSKADIVHTHSQYLTAHQDISHLATKEDVNSKQDKGNYALKSDIPTKLSSFENDMGYTTENPDLSIYATKEELSANKLPPNTIIQRNDPTIVDSNYKICDGSNVSPDDYPSLSITNVKFYRLCNITRSTYDDNGNITFRFFHNDLWTTDPDICKKKNPDLRNLYRRLRYRGDDDLGGATEHNYIQNYNKTDYKRFGENYNFINVQEELTMVNGVITSVSEFYDGEYRVELTEFVEVNSITGDSLNYINKYDYKDYNAVADTKQGNVETNKGYYIEGATQQKPHYYFFSGAETDRKISDNQYLTWCVDGKYIGFNNGEEGSTAYVDVTHKVLNNSSPADRLPCTIIFDFITPPTFVATRDIFHGYRSLIFRIADTTGKLNVYIAGYKSSNTLKWRISNLFTGYTLEPNRKYRLVYICTYGKPDDATSAMAQHYIYIYQYNELETDFLRLSTDSTNQFIHGHALGYAPYNYYSSYGMRTMYCADATAWTKGLFIDLLSLRIQNVGDTTYQNYGNEFRMAKLYYQDPVDNGLALPRITGKDGCKSYIKVK